MKRSSANLRYEAAVRVIADVIILNAALLASLVANHLTFPAGKSAGEAIVEPYLTKFWILTLIGISVFWLMGFYTRGRAYVGRYKAVIVLQGSTLAFLVFGFVTRFLARSGAVRLRSLLMSWISATAVLLGARLWATIWTRLVTEENRRNGFVAPSVTPESKRVLLIGGAGYIGSALVPKLLNAGHRVRLLDAFLYGYEPINQWKDHPGLEIVHADFRQVDVVVRAMRGVESVVHLGAIVGDPACALDEELTIDINLLATRMIAEVTMGEGIERFIFASTCSVYGASDLYLDEHSSLRPVSLYARSKVACERVLQGMKCDRFEPIILRFGTIYGLSGRTRFDLVVNLLTAKAQVERVITVFGSDQWRPFLHVDDAARAVYMALEAPRTAVTDTIFNVGSNGQNLTLGDVGRLIHEIVPEAELQFFEENVDRRNYRVNFDRIRKSLRFRPEWTVEMGVHQVLEAIRTGQVVNYKHPRYSNVLFLSEEVGTSSLRNQRERWLRDVLEVNDKGPVPIRA
jgi:nucleoside-diphosphate-sugar epimerase